ncbi:hypothetical protein [Novipirellula aureliae]|uniref:hypothetical protein n=1 Tax=Novipirellula aureliae TaxID=2527966 RepID=UPI0011B7F7FD|nr:hypothetical protein [Novipirellula aureliae]
MKTATTIRRRVLKNRTRAPARCSGVNPRRTCLENHVKRANKPRCIYDSCRRLESCSRDPIGYVDGMSLYRAYFSLNALDPLGMQFLDPYSPGDVRGCRQWALQELAKADNLSLYEQGQVKFEIHKAYQACVRRVNELPIDDRPLNPGVDIEEYNCAGLALRTFDNELYHSELVRDYLLSKGEESDCSQDCKCGQTKCRLWTWTTVIYDGATGLENRSMTGDFHIVCSKIPGPFSGMPEITTLPEPRSYEKIGQGPVTGPIRPSDATPTPGIVPNVPKSDFAVLEGLKETCFCY